MLTLDSDQIFDKARIVNCALLAKIHTVEWTPAILAHPALQIGMNANWWGIVGEKLTKQSEGSQRRAKLSVVSRALASTIRAYHIL